MNGSPTSATARWGLQTGPHDADWLRAMVANGGGWANIPPKRNRRDPVCFSPWLDRKRNLIERVFNTLKHYRRIAPRYDKPGSSFLAMTKLACIRLGLRHNEPTAKKLQNYSNGSGEAKRSRRAALPG